MSETAVVETLPEGGRKETEEGVSFLGEGGMVGRRRERRRERAQYFGTRHEHPQYSEREQYLATLPASQTALSGSSSPALPSEASPCA